MNPKTIVIAAAIVLAFASCRKSAEAMWTYVMIDNDHTKFYVDASSIINKGDHVEAWELADYTDNGSPWRSAKTLVYYNCRSLTSTQRKTVYLSGSMGAGSEVQVVEDNKDYSPSQSGTPAERLTLFVCSRVRSPRV